MNPTPTHPRAEAPLPARALAPLPLLSGDALPADIQVFPPGRGVEFTLKDYPGERFQMDVDAAVAERAQADLERMLARAAAGQGPRPFADKNHEDGEATFHPKRFFWAGDDPKTGGVRVQTDWTGFGAALVRARAFSYFSANFLFDRARKKFVGLIGENIGGLVNRPGFATQQAFAKAAQATNPTPNTMTQEEVNQVVSEALKPLTDKLAALEARARAAETAAARAGADTPLDKHPLIAALEARLKALETAASNQVLAAARATVETLGVKGGRIAPQDKEAIEYWTQAIAANAKAADALAKITPNPAFLQIVAATGGDVRPPAGKSAQDFADLVLAKAKGATDAKGRAAAVDAAIAENPEAYAAWRAANGLPGLRFA